MIRAAVALAATLSLAAATTAGAQKTTVECYSDKGAAVPCDDKWFAEHTTSAGGGYDPSWHLQIRWGRLTKSECEKLKKAAETQPQPASAECFR